MTSRLGAGHSGKGHIPLVTIFLGISRYRRHKSATHIAGDTPSRRHTIGTHNRHIADTHRHTHRADTACYDFSRHTIPSRPLRFVGMNASIRYTHRRTHRRHTSAHTSATHIGIYSDTRRYLRYRRYHRADTTPADTHHRWRLQM